MTMRRAGIQLQLREPITGRFDCTAYGAAEAGDADTRGRLVYTGRQVRLNTDEPKPDPASPGLNLRQTDESLFRLSNGAIDLDTRWNEPWANVDREAKQGKWVEGAIWRQVLLDHGIGTANRFAKGHAITFTWDQDRGIYIIADSLIPVYLDAPGSVLRDALAALVITAGVPEAQAGAYVSLTRDVYDEAAQPVPVRRSIAFRGGVSFFVYRVVDLKIVNRGSIRLPHNSSAPSAPIRQIYWPAQHSNRRLARITKGFLAGSYVEPGAIGVREVIAA
jgi:hypothetical protein